MQLAEFKYESDFYRFIFSDDILSLTYIEGPITIDIAKEVVQKRLELTGGQSVLLLVDDEDLKGIDRDARDYLSSDEAVEGLIAAALLSSNYFSRHLANFFLKITAINKPKIPAKVFGSRAEAKKWLKQYK